MSYDIEDPVELSHPLMPGEIVIRSRRQMPAMQEAGWVEAKSPEAEAAVEANTSPEDTITGDES